MRVFGERQKMPAVAAAVGAASAAATATAADQMAFKLGYFPRSGTDATQFCLGTHTITCRPPEHCVA